VAAAAAGWLELCDYLPAHLAGIRSLDATPRSICAAGHKAMYHEAWGGPPAADFLDALHPGLARLGQGFAKSALPSDRLAGRLTATVAHDLGLPPGLPVAVGALDAHLGAVGAGAAPGILVKIIGTSTCDCLVAPLSPALPDIPGVCGIVPESIVPGMLGIEAGQSAVGDIFDWFVRRIQPGGFGTGAEAHTRLSEAAAALRAGESGLLALDWHHGNRTVLVDPLLTGLIVGETLQTTPGEIYRALIEATAFGALTIIDRLEAYGVRVERIVNCGGIAEKSPLVMQIYADATGRPMEVSRSGQTCALGAAIVGAVAGGAHRSVPDAQRAMTGVSATRYLPRAEAAAVYRRLYRLYGALHDAFGVPGAAASLSHLMKELIDIRQQTRQAPRPGTA
jgi:L-ribulokinase